ncbi:hypothetical protein [Fontibacillus sp. BL9]
MTRRSGGHTRINQEKTSLGEAIFQWKKPTRLVSFLPEDTDEAPNMERKT